LPLFLYQEIVEVLLAHDNDNTAIHKLSINSLKESDQTNAAKLVENALISPKCATKYSNDEKKLSILPSVTGIDQ
jgi:hypothetical protein